MARNIFTKYILTFMVIVTITLLTISLVVVSLVSNYTLNMKTDLMDNTAENVFSSINGVMAMGKMPLESILKLDNGYIVDMLNNNAEMSDAVVFITDHNGDVLVSSDNAKDIIPNTISKELVEGYLSEDYLFSTLDGIFETDHINIIRPINIFPTGKVDYNSEYNLGAIFVCSENDNPLFERLGSTILMTIVWMFIISLLAVYFVSERITRPLKEMRHAAKSFAQGKFNVRVPVRGNDEISELAIAFNNMAGSLEELDENRSLFLSNVAHDLRTPMTTISGFIDGILTGAIPKEKTDHYLEIIASEVKRLARLVSSLLDITRLQSGSRKYNMTSFDACELLREVLISCEARIDEKNLEVNFECDEDNMRAYADKDAIHQIMYNLVDNAIKFSNNGGRLLLKVKEDAEKLFITVHNTGVGISATDLPKVFEQFYKSDRSRGLDKSGVGLGLYISKTIIDQHGEEMWVKSEEGRYCTFTFTLAKDKKTK